MSVMNVREIIEKLGGAAIVAREMGLPGGDVGAKQIRAWCFRDSIPAEWFAALSRTAEGLGNSEITVEFLAQMAEERRQRRKRVVA